MNLFHFDLLDENFLTFCFAFCQDFILEKISNLGYTTDLNLIHARSVVLSVHSESPGFDLNAIPIPQNVSCIL